MQGTFKLAELAFNYVIKDVLKLDPYHKAQISSIFIIPWFLKPVWGLISDTIPICGLRRKSYLVIFSVVFVISFVSLFFYYKVKMIVILFLFLGSTSMAFQNVIGEALIVESSNTKGIDESAMNVSNFFTWRAVGAICTSIVSGYLLEAIATQYLFLISSIFPIIIFLFSLCLKEEKVSDKKGNNNISPTNQKDNKIKEYTGIIIKEDMKEIETITTEYNQDSPDSPNNLNIPNSINSLNNLNNPYSQANPDSPDIFNSKQTCLTGETRETADVTDRIPVSSTYLTEENEVKSIRKSSKDSYQELDPCGKEHFKSFIKKPQAISKSPLILEKIPSSDINENIRSSTSNSGSGSGPTSKYGKLEISESNTISEYDSQNITCKSQLTLLWNFIKQDFIYKPIFFIFIFSAIPSYEDAMFYYYTNFLKFRPKEIGLLSFTYGISSLIGVLVYRMFLYKYSFRAVMFGSLLVCLIFNQSSLILVFRWNINLGIPDFVFCFASNALKTALSEINTMPILVLACNMCPKNIEGTTYALLMSVGNLAIFLGYNIGGLFTYMLGVTSNNFDNLWKLILLSNSFLIIPLVFIWCVDEKKIIENISKVNAARKEIEDSKENSNNNTNNIGDEVI